jgi:hypothetical protein
MRCSIAEGLATKPATMSSGCLNPPRGRAGWCTARSHTESVQFATCAGSPRPQAALHRCRADASVPRAVDHPHEQTFLRLVGMSGPSSNNVRISPSGIPKRTPRRYTFPCEGQPLYTHDVPAARRVAFEAATFALHHVHLPPGAPLATHLRRPAPGGAGGASGDCGDEEPALLFEVFECAAEAVDGGEGGEGDDECVAAGALPVSTILNAMDFDSAAWKEVRWNSRIWT